MRRVKNIERLIAKGFTKQQILDITKTKSPRSINYWLEREYSIDEAKTLAASKLPGTYEYYLIFKKMKEEDARKASAAYIFRKRNTLENFIIRHGELEGKRKWDVYTNKHRIKNTFEYKRDKLGWTKEKFDVYNKSRAVTFENLMKRHGDVKGGEIWDSYIAKQVHTKSKEYVLNKFGADGARIWKELCESKTHNYVNFLKRNGNDVELATEKYNEYLKTMAMRNIAFSVIANELFDMIYPKLIDMNFKKIFCKSYTQEWFLSVKDFGCIFLDFFLKETGKVIEFYGDYWHANPAYYTSDELVNLRSGGILPAKQIWDRDAIRLDHIKKIPYIKDVLIIWEDDYRSNKEFVVKKCMEFLIN